jgi:hypothetical protein
MVLLPLPEKWALWKPQAFVLIPYGQALMGPFVLLNFPGGPMVNESRKPSVPLYVSVFGVLLFCCAVWAAIGTAIVEWLSPPLGAQG